MSPANDGTQDGTAGGASDNGPFAQRGWNRGEGRRFGNGPQDGRAHEGRNFEGRGFGRRCGGGSPFELVAMILGFIVFWPLGLAILFWRMMRRNNGPMPFAANFGNWQSNWSQGSWSNSSAWGGSHSGNSAFDDWKTAELERLEQERRKLADAQKAFGEHLSNLRKAKDRAQFDEFMQAYRAKPTE